MDNSIDDWVKHIGNNPVPVLEHTIKELRNLIAKENTGVNELVSVVERDPGLTVHLFRLMNSKSTSSLRTEVTSVQQALMLMGTAQLNKLPAELPALETTLDASAKTRLLKTFGRAYHAAQQATEWASMRRDMNPDEVFSATQLNFLGEMYVAMLQPDKLDQVDQMRNEKNIASDEAQYIVLGFTLDQLTAKLARLWKLPQLVLDALHPENAKFPRAYGIMLAVQLARGAAVNWYSDKTHNIQEHAAKWLDKDIDEIIRNTHVLGAEIARESNLYKVCPAAFGLLCINNPIEKVQEHAVTDDAVESEINFGAEADICLTPQVDILKTLLSNIKNNNYPDANAYELISFILKGMHDGIGLNRVLFATINHDNKTLQPEKIIGAASDPVFNRFEISLKTPNLFTRLLEKTQAVLIKDSNRTKFWPMVPVEVQKIIGTNSFVAMSIVLDNKPIGLFYADRHSSACQLDDRSYHYFKTICNHTAQAMSKLTRLDFSSSH
jgi:HD-like signal output (HDOD) protein